MTLALIISASVDEPNWGPVRAALTNAGLEVTVFEADRVARGEHNFTYTQRDDSAVITLGAQAFDLRDVRAAWWRKPHWLSISRSDLMRKRSLEHEINRVQQALWSSVASSAWLNDPDQIRLAGCLSRQLAIAADISLTTPETMVTNSWKELRAFASGRPIAFKALNGHYETEDEPARTVFTRRLTTDDLDELQGRSLPYPGVAQAFIDKAREWRVTVVGEQVFAAAIYSHGSARMDWRREQHTDRVRFAAEELPSDVARQCCALTTRLGLRYAAIDLIEQADGTFVFLEANPNGQYLWLEEELGLPVSAAIADVLVATAHRPMV